MLTLVAPVLQVNVLAPLAVKVAVLPVQIVAELTVTIGIAFTVTVEVAEFLQPFAFVPVTV